MASSSGTSSGGSAVSSTQLQNSGSEEDLQLLMNQRKQKRMLSNRESARRSRMRKQKHLDDLMGQVSLLRKENSHILTNLHITTQQYINIESENSVLRAQMGELSHRLHSLTEIATYLDANNLGGGGNDDNGGTGGGMIGVTMDTEDPLMNPWNSIYMMNQPIMASPDMFQY